MPYDDPDPSDPTMLVGVALPGSPQATLDMAYAFAEEFARAGMGEEAIFGLFADAFYAGPHRAYRALGDRAVREIVRECVGVWGRAPGRVVDAPAGLRDDVHRLPWPTSPWASSGGDPAGATTSPGEGRE